MYSVYTFALICAALLLFLMEKWQALMEEKELEKKGCCMNRKGKSIRGPLFTSDETSPAI
jgi:hypothetical protein